MSTTSAPAIRHSLRCCISPLRLQKRWAQVHDVRFVATHQDTNKIIDRYKQKLVKKAKQEGHGSISSLKDAYKDKIQDYRRVASKIPCLSIPKNKTSPFQQTPPPPPSQPQAHASSPLSKPAWPSAAPGTPGIIPLSSYLDLGKVSGLPKKELEYVWRLRNASDPLSLCAVVPLETYNRIHRIARDHPQFILPLPRPTGENGSGDVNTGSNGFESGNRIAADIHFLQWGFHPPSNTNLGSNTKTANTHTSTVLFTHLASYKLHGEFAPPHTTITHHLDLADSHGLVLLNGSVIEGRGVSVEEGRWLLMCLQKFYDFEGHGSEIGKEKRQSLLEKFSKGDQEFKIEDLVDEAERVS